MHACLDLIYRGDSDRKLAVWGQNKIILIAYTASANGTRIANIDQYIAKSMVGPCILNAKEQKHLMKMKPWPFTRMIFQ